MQQWVPKQKEAKTRRLRLVPPKESLCPLCWLLLAEEDLGRQIFNFCGLRSFTPVNSNSPGLVGHGVHFFRTLPPMRAAILKKIQQSQPPRW